MTLNDFLLTCEYTRVQKVALLQKLLENNVEFSLNYFVCHASTEGSRTFRTNSPIVHEVISERREEDGDYLLELECNTLVSEVSFELDTDEPCVIIEGFLKTRYLLDHITDIRAGIKGDNPVVFSYPRYFDIDDEETCGIVFPTTLQ